jgi:hypothetical protein|tara:strand:+ start:642 stop:1013 length:372 start_codon:yes stop_codon:yes gene_type:complete
MIYYDKKSYEEHRDATLNILKLFQVGLATFALVVLVMIAMTGCYNAAMMRASGESRQVCQSDSDCPADRMCVYNISPNSTLGECVDNANYDPWKNRRLEDFIKLKEKQKQKDKKDWKPIQQNK